VNDAVNDFLDRQEVGGPTCAKFIGTFRIYRNADDARLAWCIAPSDGSWELAVKQVRIETPTTTARTATAAASTWLEAIGELQLGDDGIAVIKAVP